ncbi:MAG: proteasome accessory factor PafA2 family protein [Candidatus Sungiibacteriota bacterium]
MEKRAFGIELEYPIACRGKDKEFHTRFFVESLATGVPVSMSPSIFIKEALPFRDDAPERLKQLLFFPPEKRERWWLASNGALFYFDIHDAKFPEYATPECSNPREALIQSAAGDIIVEDLRQEALRLGLLGQRFGGRFNDLFVFRMNTFFRENVISYDAAGCHENYMTLEEFTPSHRPDTKRFHEFCNFMVPFLQGRQIFDGAGGIRCDPAKGWQYVISQRAFFIEKKSSGKTMGVGRGFIHFRDHRNDMFPQGKTRLHLHCGDSTMSPWGKYIAMIATHLVLRAIEEVDMRGWKYRFHPSYFKSDLQALASDPTLKTEIRVLEGDSLKKISAMNLQREYAEFVQKAVKNFSPEERDMFRVWTAMIDKLSRDPMEASRELDWVIKLNFLRERCGGDFGSKKARSASAFYHDISGRGIYNKLLLGGEVEPFAAKEEIEAARFSPPPTRGEFRSRYLKVRLQKPDDLSSYHQWGVFTSAFGSISIPDPLERTSVRGEDFLRGL